MDKDLGKKVAIKKITHAFDDHVDAKRILREIKLMRVFDHENVIRIIDLVPPPPTIDEFEDIYIVLVRAHIQASTIEYDLMLWLVLVLCCRI